MTNGAPLYLRAEPQRLPRQATVAIEAIPLRRRARDVSAVAGQPMWWPPAKVAGRYLAPFLATARPEPLSSRLLADRVAVPGPPLSEADFADALELALLLADCDARWGDFSGAVRALDAAEALRGALPPEYEAKRASGSPRTDRGERARLNTLRRVGPRHSVASRPETRVGGVGSNDRSSALPRRRPSRAAPAALTARLTSAAAMIAAACAGERMPSLSPSVTTAEGTPS
jgi:hypothetical protein